MVWKVNVRGVVAKAKGTKWRIGRPRTGGRGDKKRRGGAAAALEMWSGESRVV